MDTQFKDVGTNFIRGRNMQDIKDFFVMVILPVVAVLAVILTPIILLDAYGGKSYGEVTGRKTRYVMLTCYAETADSRMIPCDELNYRAITNE